MLSTMYGVSQWMLVPLGETNSIEEKLILRGTFGDKFGAVNALFSGLSLIGILVAIYLQWNELKETKSALQREKFEAIFFQAITHLNDCEKSISCDTTNHRFGSAGIKANIINGKNAFTFLMAAGLPVEHFVEQNDIIHTSNFFNTNYGSVNDDLHNYFLTITATSELISSYNEKTNDDTQTYKKYFRSYISPTQAFILAVTSIYEGNFELKNAIINLEILRPFNNKSIDIQKYFGTIFPPSAYGLTKFHEGWGQ
ncbi:hypothetical protein OVA03_00975 [Asticcacaulis sp. SL142]|uniref:hypothetical protein n=1 Tax=Asticcacaulis sp. SL142 TaxID=2995155 RepID=UPI00226D269E|nr:hypothetical protein [Asticcacaulis sp. SL142]WAC48539.1 hypothetical protein OVA03_00975 [Asticcacaulis sp. SL142]